MPGLWKGLAGVVCLLLVVLGIRWMFLPHATSGEFGIVLSTPVALNTARGDLGGMFMAGAILAAWGLITGEGRWLRAVAAVIACVAFGRMVGVMLDGYAPMSVISIVIEIVMVTVLLKAAATI